MSSNSMNKNKLEKITNDDPSSYLEGTRLVLVITLRITEENNPCGLICFPRRRRYLSEVPGDESAGAG
jgi:hypothetical protein